MVPDVRKVSRVTPIFPFEGGICTGADKRSSSVRAGAELHPIEI